MGKHLQSLKDAAKAPTSIFFLYQRRRKKEDNTLFNFFEGDNDAAFYKCHIRRVFGSVPNIQYADYICNGRENVLAVLDKIKNLSLAKKNALFFIDRDFADFLPKKIKRHKNLYITDNYSFESDLVSVQAVEVVFADILSLNQATENLLSITGTFFKAHEDFSKKMASYSGLFISLLQRKESPILQNLKLKDFLSLCPKGHIRKRVASTKEIMKKINVAENKYSFSAHLNLAKKLKATANKKSFIRGKYEIDFMLMFIKHMQAKILKKPRPKASRKRILSKELNVSTLVDILPPRLTIPNSLDKFLKASRRDFLKA